MDKLSDDLLMSKNQNFNIQKHCYKTATTMANMHYHKHFEILYITQNTRELYVNEKKTIIDKNHIAVIPPYVVHKTNSGESLPQDRILINFKLDFFDDFYSSCTEKFIECFDAENCVMSLNHDLSEKVYGIMKSMLVSKKEDDAVELKLQLLRLLNILYSIVSVNLVKTDSFNSAMKKIVKYVATHYDETITLDFLENKFGLNKFEISRSFSKYSGKSLVKYLNDVRIMKAKELLCNSSSSVTEISVLCGFENVTNFNRVFKSRENCSPTYYRQLMK